MSENAIFSYVIVELLYIPLVGWLLAGSG